MDRALGASRGAVVCGQLITVRPGRYGRAITIDRISALAPKTAAPWVSPAAPLSAAESAATVYGLDIETDTEAGGLDPGVAAVVAVAVAGDGWTRVIDGNERRLLVELDKTLAGLGDGVIVTWNGSRFDLPFLADRARALGIRLGLRMTVDDRRFSTRDPLPGHAGGYTASWYRHRHLDAYQVYRSDVGASLGLPCGLKPLARFVGLIPIEVDRSDIHSLEPRRLAEYVASDAVLTRELALRRWPTARRAIDPDPLDRRSSPT